MVEAELGDIFPDNARTTTNTAKVRHSPASLRRTSTVSEEAYPMFVLPVPILLQLTEMLPHQDMLKTGQLVQVTPQHIGKIIFVSHEWTGHATPDPKGEQLRCLQNLLTRLAAGEEDGVQSTWIQQVMFKSNVRVRAKGWAKHLLHMFVCKYREASIAAARSSAYSC